MKKKKILSALTAGIMMLSTVVTTESGLFNNLFTAEAQYSNVYGHGYLDMDCYVAGLMVDESNPIHTTLNTMLSDDTPSDIMVKSISSDGWFMGEMATWEALTFKPSDITETTINEIGYYETLILKSLKTSVSTDIVKKIFDEQATKDSKRLFSIFKNAVKLDYAYNLDFNKLSTQEQNNIIEEFEKSFSKAFPDMKSAGKAVGIFSDLVKAGKTYEEAINNIASYMACSDLSEYMKRVVSDLYSNCNGAANPTMKQALLNINSACQGYEMAFNSAMFDLGSQGFSTVFGKVVDEMFDDIVGSNSFGAGALIGQAIGKNVSNILFSTDATREQYYKMRTMCNFEALLRNVTKKEMANFKSNPTKDNANILFSAIDLLYSQYDISCDLAIEYADIVFTKNIASFFNSNSDKYNQFVSSVNNMKQINDQNYKITIKESYIYYLEDDYPDVYESLIAEMEEDKEEVVTIKPVTGIAFPVDSVEWGMEDTGLNNGNAQVTPRDATNPQITYTSSDESVITYGIFGPEVHKPGKAVITATSVSSGLTATLNVTVVKGNGADGVYYEPVTPGEKPVIGGTFTVNNITYKIKYSNQLEVLSARPDINGIIIVPSKVCYKNELFSVTKIADAKSAAKGAFSNGGSYASKDYDVRKIILPNSTTYIGRYAFCYCKNLKYIEIPEGVTSLGYSLFDFSGVTTVIIPKSLQSLGGCGASGSTLNYGGFPVKEVYYRGSKKDWDNLPDASGDYKGLKSVKVYFMSPSIYERGDKFTVDDLQYEVTADNEVKVYKCNTSIVSVTIPENVLYENYNFKVSSIAGYAFDGCTKLKSIDVSENNENYSSIDGILFNKNNTELIRCPEGKDIKYVIPNSVKKICNYAFQNCSSLTSIEIPDNVTEIGEYTFKDCNSLTSVEIPDSVTKIGYDAFNGCSSLTSIKIPNGVTEITSSAFDDCNSLISISVSEDNENYSSIDGVLFNKNKTELIRCPEGKDIEYVIPDSVTKIGYNAFNGCSSLTNIEIPNSVKIIEKYAFYGCSSLTSINIPKSVTSIEDSTFYNCKCLTGIEIPDSVTEIGYDAFGNCENLTSITIKNHECKIYDYSRTISYTATIYSYENSTAQAYAEKYDRNFVSLGEAPEFMISDIVKLKKWLVKSGDLDNEDFTKYDLYNDGTLNVFDFIIMKRRISNT